MNERTRYAIGLDVGVTNTKSVCVKPDGVILCRKSIATEADKEHWPDHVKRLIEEIETERGTTHAIGVAAPGIAAPDGECISWMQGRLDKVEGLNWTTFLSRSTRVPVLNDAQAALLGETWLGAARGAADAMLLTLGTGIGGALMVDGRLLRGHLGRAGHLGHISLDPNGPLDISNTPGSLEEAIGNCTIQKRSNGRFSTTHDLIAACEAEDLEALEIWNRSIRALAAGVASLINVVDPEVVILGGGIARAAKTLLDPLQRELDRFEWRPQGRQVRLVIAELGEYAGAIGAAKNALDAR